MISKLPAPAIGTIQHFAEQMGTSAYEAPDGSFSFVFSESGRLTIAAADDNYIAVTLTSPLLFEDLEGIALLLPMGGFRPELDHVVHVGLNKAGQGVLAVKAESTDFDLPFLERSMSVLSSSFATIPQ